MRQKNLNKRGFTLIELLAVIAILAILMMLAASSVTGIIASSSKRAFAIDAQSVLDAAKLAYTDAILSGKSVGSSYCIPLSTLKGKYLEKMDSYNHGSVQVSISSGVATYHVWLASERYKIAGVTYSNIKEDSVEDASGVDTKFDNCGAGA